MSYTNQNWTCVSASLNQGQETITPYGGSPTVYNAPNLFIYGSPSDALATIAAANYFLAEYASLAVGDVIIANGTDGSNLYIVTASSSTSVTVDSFTPAGSVATANIQNNAVTFAKFQEVATHTLVGNPTGGTTEVSEVGIGNGLEFNSTNLRVPLSNLVYAAVAVSAAEFNGMYAAPKLLVAAQGANTQIIVDQMVLAMTYGSANYAAGGVVAAQYDSTIHGAGVLATATEAAADFQAAASTSFRLVGSLAIAPFSTTVNKGIYLSNQTAAFTTGDSDFVAHVWYRVVPTV